MRLAVCSSFGDKIVTSIPLCFESAVACGIDTSVVSNQREAGARRAARLDLPALISKSSLVRGRVEVLLLRAPCLGSN